MRFELTISGLCVIAMKSQDKAKDPRPRNPERVDIIVPDAHHHKCCLVWDPFDVVPEVEPNLIVNTVGDRLGSLDLDRYGKQKEHAMLTLQFLSDTDPGFDVSWGPESAEQPTNASEEPWMNWVPTMEAIGFPATRVPPFGTDALGARARISLPFGKIVATDLVTRPGSTEHLIWHFSNGSRNAVANRVRYVVDDVRGYDFLDAAGKPLIGLEVEGPRTVRMCISNDMQKVPKTFTAGIDELHHFSHLDVLVPESQRPRAFTPPRTIDSQRTGDHICTQVVNVWDDKTG